MLPLLPLLLPLLPPPLPLELTFRPLPLDELLMLLTFPPHSTGSDGHSTHAHVCPRTQHPHTQPSPPTPTRLIRVSVNDSIQVSANDMPDSHAPLQLQLEFFMGHMTAQEHFFLPRPGSGSGARPCSSSHAQVGPG